MKAYVLHGVNDLRYSEIAIPECNEEWAIVKVMAAGICSSDIARIFTKGTYHFPTIPGHEFAGVVDSVGSNKNSSLVGKHVGVFPLIPCKECTQCKEKHYEMCAHYDYVGSRRDGGFAEYVAVPVWNLIPLPENIPFTSAAMLEPLSVALHAMKMAEFLRGQSVGIIGTGMIGISAAQWAYKFGAGQVTLMGRNEKKRKLIEKIGLAYDVCTSIDSLSEYDVVLEAVGSVTAVNMAINAVAPGGRLILMGNPSDDIVLPQDVYWRILRKQITLRGTWNSSYDGKNASDWIEAIEALRTGELDIASLVSHSFRQEELVKGLKIMLEHKEPYCKIITTWNDCDR